MTDVIKTLVETEGYKMEYNETTDRFRLVNKVLSTFSGWCVYTQIATLNGMVAHTAYFADKEGIVTAHEFVKMIGVGEAKTNHLHQAAD